MLAALIAVAGTGLLAGSLVAAPRTRQAGGAGAAARRAGPAVTCGPTGDRALRSPASEKRRAGTLAQGARRQAKRDSR